MATTPFQQGIIDNNPHPFGSVEHAIHRGSSRGYIPGYGEVSPEAEERAYSGASFVGKRLAIEYTDDALILLSRSLQQSSGGIAPTGLGSRISALPMPLKVLGGVGVGAGALLAGNALFGVANSGRAYNPIEGFPEKGFAKAQRQDFGSGYKGTAAESFARGNYVLFDVETTSHGNINKSSIFREQNRLLQISALRVEQGKVVSRFNQYVNPGIDFSSGVSGITPEMVAGKPGQKEALSSFWNFVGEDSTLVGHNIKDFDLPFIGSQMKREGLVPRHIEAVDTLLLADRFHELPRSKSLGSLASAFKISTVGAHDALRDVEILHGVLGRLGGEIDYSSVMAAEKGSFSFGGTLGVVKRSPWKVPLSAGWRKGLVIAGGGILLAAGIGTLFSGKDDAYNTIEGFSHTGLASYNRKRETDFGSGYQGLRVGGQQIPVQIQEFREQWAGKEDELRRKIRTSGTEYGTFTTEELRVRGKRAQVNMAGFTPKWEDADTLLLQSQGRKDIAIRLTGIDAPEVYKENDPTNWFRYHQAQPRGEWATQTAREWTANTDLRVEVAADPKQKTYGRYIGLVYRGANKVPMNLEMVQQGVVAALPFGESGSDIYSRKKFISAEQQAISQNKGIWQEEFFQRYLEVSKGVGGRITFNKFTDLSRLSKNFHLAAAEAFISGNKVADARPYARQSDGRRLGQRLIPSQGRFFSGRGRVGNTVEGFQEKGFGKANREDFGSGWKGLFGGISRSISKFLAGSGTKTILSPTRAMAMAAGKTAEEFGSSLGNVVFLKTEAQIGRIKSLIPGWERAGGAASVADASGKNFIFVDPSHVGRSFEQRAVKLGMAPESAKRATQSEDFLKTVIYHEQLEREVSSSFAKTRTMPTKHIGSQVMIGEGGFVANLENKEVQELFRTVRGGNRAERKAFALGEHLFSRPANIGDPVNPIEGMRHGGLAEKLRKIFSMFGSKYDLVRGFVKMGERSYEQTLASEAFQRALSSGVVKEKIGEGLFGTVHRMETEFEGKTFSYVRKQLHSDLDQRLEREFAEKGLDVHSRGYYERGKDLTKESSFLRELQGTESVPTPYGGSRTELFMEHMPGSSLPKGFQPPTQSLEALQRTQNTAYQAGIVNTDIHGGNILYDPKTKRLSFFDFGLGSRTSNTEILIQGHQEMNLKFKKELGSAYAGVEATRETAMAVIRSGGRNSLNRSSEQLRQDKISTWKRGRDGGRGHESRNRGVPANPEIGHQMMESTRNLHKPR